MAASNLKARVKEQNKQRFNHRYNVNGPYKYPIDDTDYRGKITFEAYQEESETLAKTIFGDDLLVDNTRDETDTAEANETANKFVQEWKKFQQEAKRVSDNRDLKKERPKIGTGRKCTLYLPGQIQFADAVGYSNVDLGILGNAASVAMRTGTSGREFMSAALGGAMQLGMDDAVRLFNEGPTSATAQVAALRIARRLNSSVAGAITTETGIALNPNKRASLVGPNLRTFRFSFKMIPTSQEEAEMVKSIVKYFREEMYPEQITELALSSAMRYPSKFLIKMWYGGYRVAHNILPCFLSDVNVVYNQSGMGFHSDGNFQETDISLAFTEERTLTKRDVALDNY